jgi:hypothetical protein
MAGKLFFVVRNPTAPTDVFAMILNGMKSDPRTVGSKATSTAALRMTSASCAQQRAAISANGQLAKA